MLTNGQAIERKRFDLIEWQRRSQATGVGAIVGGQPVTVAMNRESQTLVDALCWPLTVAAQVSCWPVLHEPRNVGIERGLAFGAGGHRAIAEQDVHVGAAEGQRCGKRAFKRDRVRIRADRRGEQHAGTVGRRGTRRLPALCIGGDQLLPIRIRPRAGVVPAPRQPRRTPELRQAANAVLHACRASSIRRANSSAAGSSSKARHGRCD